MICLGCDNDVAQTNSNGLCAACQKERAGEARTATSAQTMAVPAPEKKRRGPGRKPKADSPHPKRKYTRRKKVVDGGMPALLTREKTGIEIITELRARYQEEYDKAEHELAVMLVKLQVADEILEGMKKG